MMKRMLFVKEPAARLTNGVLYLSALVLVAFSMLSAQTVGKISGLVTDAETGEPLIGCNVAVAGTTLGASTDLDGAFFVLNIPPG